MSLVRRRILIAALGSLLAPHQAAAQGAQRLRHVGILSLTRERPGFWQIFEETLRERGWREGENIAFAYQLAGSRREPLHVLAAELVEMPVDVIVADLGTPLVAARATKQIPIVMRMGLDAVEAGLVGNLGRPERNLTGLTGDVTAEIIGKRLELLREVAPTARSVAVLSSIFHGIEVWMKELDRAARNLGFAVHVVQVKDAQELAAAFEEIRAAANETLFCGGDPVTFPARARITAFALREGLPAVYGPAEWAEAGGLISYGVNIPELYRQTAGYVDKILRGATPAELSVRRPAKYDLAVNLKTARVLGITVPQSILVRADRLFD